VTETALTENRLLEVLSEYLGILQPPSPVSEEFTDDNAARLFATLEEGLNR